MELRNYSPRTITTYTTMLRFFLNYCSKDISKITRYDLQEFLHHRLTNDHVSVATINQTISAWKIVYTQLLGKEWEELRIARPRLNKRLPVVLSQSEVKCLIKATLNKKHSAILKLLYSTGIRRNELLSLKPTDIDSKRMVINVRQGKGKKDRQVTLHPKLLVVLRDYYKYYRPHTYLFEGYIRGSKYSATSVNKIIWRSAGEAGISKKVSVHTFRHSYATHMLEKGVNLKLIQMQMGHSSLKTTSVYLSLANIDLSTLPNPLD